MTALVYRCRCCLQTFTRQLVEGEVVEVPPSDAFVCGECASTLGRTRDVGGYRSDRARFLDVTGRRRGGR